MPITATEIKTYDTVNGGLGGAIDTGTEILSGTSNNVFDKFTGAESAAGGVFYACIYIRNTHGTLTAESLQSWIDSETDHGGVNVSIGKGTSTINGTEQTIANENTAPAGVDFDTYDPDDPTTGAGTPDSPIPVGDLPAGQHQAFWLRVTIQPATLAKTGYITAIKHQFDTAE